MHLKQTYYKKNKYEAGADEAGRGLMTAKNCKKSKEMN